MFDETIIKMLLEGTWATLYMTLFSTFYGYVIGLPLGVILTITDKDGIKPNAVVYKLLDFTDSRHAADKADRRPKLWL